MPYAILRKILVVIIIILPVFADYSCKKQPKCGCDKDVISTLTREPAYVYFDVEDGTARFTPVLNPSANYYFCNPSQFMSYLSKFESGQILLISGPVFWECNYLYNSSNYMYYQPSYRVYQINVTAIEEDLYGK
jgi:hypothetical protein